MRARSSTVIRCGLAVVLIMLLAFAMALASGCGGSDTTTTTGAAGETTTTGADGETTTTGAEPGADDPEVTLSMVSFLDKSHELTQTLLDWIEAVETATNGTVKIEWKGGPEVIPPLEQIEAVRTGIVDINANVSAYYAQLNPAVKVLTMSPYSPTEERGNGVFEYIQREHAAIDTVYLGRWMGELPFYLFLKKEISSPDELKGMSIRTRANYDKFFNALGISGVSVDHAEVYTALERGIAEGFGWTLLGVTDSDWDTKAPFMLDHGFWAANNATILFNPDSWAKLSANQQDAIAKATADYEKDKMVPYFVTAQEGAREKLLSRGVKFFTFSEADAEEFVALADRVEWAALEAEMPEKFAEVRGLFNLSD